MSQTTINPYLNLGAQHAAGLNYLQGVLIASMPFDGMNNVVWNGYIQPAFFPPIPPPPIDQFTLNELTSIIPTAVNAYVNPTFDNYSDEQMFFINMLLNTIISDVPVDSIKDFILDVEDNITKSGLTAQEQIPLLMATAIGAADYDYWTAQLAAPGNWLAKGYFDANVNINRTNLPYWVQAAMQATLTSANKAPDYGLIDPIRTLGVETAGINMVTALTASIGVAAGKVMYKWVPRTNLNDKFKVLRSRNIDNFGNNNITYRASIGKPCPISNGCTVNGNNSVARRCQNTGKNPTCPIYPTEQSIGKPCLPTAGLQNTCHTQNWTESIGVYCTHPSEDVRCRKHGMLPDNQQQMTSCMPTVCKNNTCLGSACYGSCGPNCQTAAC